MANVLGELFQGIADAIRGKTGDAASMKPAEFPDKIAGIAVGGGGGGGNGLTFTTGMFTATREDQVIAHGHGRVPDVIALFNPSSVDMSLMQIVQVVQFSKSMYEATDPTYPLGRTFLAGYNNLMSASLQPGGCEIDSDGLGFYGIIRKCNSSTFTAGGNFTFSLLSGVQYEWWAISGIT